LDSAQGFIAEQWHAQTLNIDAYKKGLWDLVASAPGSNTRASPDVVVRQSGEEILTVQLKYWKDARATAKQLWDPAYDNVAKVVPSDQLPGVVEASKQQAERVGSYRPEVARAATHTADAGADRVAAGGAESMPLGRDESEELTKRLRTGDEGLHVVDVLSPGEIAEKAAAGGAVGAGIGFAIGAAPHILEAIKAWRQGKGIDDEEFIGILKDAGKSGATEAGWAGLQGAVSTALVHMAAAGHLGHILEGVGPGPIGAVAVVTVNAIRDGIRLHNGEIQSSEFAARTATNSVVAAAGVGGAMIGQALIPFPVLGALVGSVVGSLVGRLGVSLASWTVQKIGPCVKEAVEAAGAALFGVDLIVECRAQTRAIDALFAQAHEVTALARQADYRAFHELRLPPINVSAIERKTNDQVAQLEAMAAKWRVR
jgi:hypothetical protein